MNDPGDCCFEWADGWGPDHLCTKLMGHAGSHRCRCDQEISQWMATHGLPQGALAEDEEEARLRIRAELEAQQRDESVR